MKNLFDQALVKDVKVRLMRLRPETTHLWGKMNPGQAVAHCAAAFEMANGDRRLRRLLQGRIFGWIVKRLALGNDDPMRRNTPTNLAITDERDLGVERERLLTLIDRFAAQGPAGCTTHPHSFFGRLTPMEWSVLMYKHLDHHLRQFGS